MHLHLLQGFKPCQYYCRALTLTPLLAIIIAQKVHPLKPVHIECHASFLT